MRIQFIHGCRYLNLKIPVNTKGQCRLAVQFCRRQNMETWSSTRQGPASTLRAPQQSLGWDFNHLEAVRFLHWVNPTLRS